MGAAVLAVKLYSLFLLYILFLRIPVRPGYEPFLYLQEGQTRESRLREIEESFAHRLTPYDGQYYLDIAGRGYRRYEEEAGAGVRVPGGNHAFFPLFAALLHAGSWLGARGALLTGVVGNLALSVAAACAVHVLARGLGIPAWPAVLLLLAFPTAVFQTVLYPESLFLLLSVLAAMSGTSGRAVRLGVLGYLAGLTRPQGILVASFSVGRWGREGEGARRGIAGWRPRLAALGPVAGMATFAGILWGSIGDPMGFLSIQSHWAREFSLVRLLGEAAEVWRYPGPPFDVAGVVLGVGLLPFLWRHLPVPLALFGTLSVAMPLSTGTMLSFGRFLSVSIPHFLCLAKMLEGRRGATVVVLAVFVVVQVVIAHGLVGWYFVG